MKSSLLKRIDTIENRVVKPTPLTAIFYHEGDSIPKGADYVFCIMPPKRRINVTRGECNQN